MRTNTTRFVAVTAIALALGGTALGTAAVANAGTMPTDGPTVAMTITNNTDNPMLLDSASNPYGQWINGPRSYLAPHTTEIVTAYSSDPRGIGVDVTYSVADGVQTVMAANNYAGNPTLDGTRIIGDPTHVILTDYMATGYPTMNASYDVFTQN